MDASRNADLSNLHRIFSDPKAPNDVRQRAYRGYQRVQKQVKDRKLSGLRLRLIRSVRADDLKTTTKIEQQIQQYSWRKGYIKK